MTHKEMTHAIIKSIHKERTNYLPKETNTWRHG